MAKSYIKIYGPPILKSLKALEKVAAEMSKKTTMRYYSVLVPQLPFYSSGDLGSYDYVRREYVGGILADIDMTEQEKVKLVSRAGDTLGEYDFFFEWEKEPSKQQVEELISMIDEALADCGCRYTIVTK